MKPHTEESVICPSDSCVSCRNRCHRQQKQPMPMRRALDLLFEWDGFQLDSEYIPVAAALNRVTAQTLFAQFSVPPTRSSQHDGVAVCHASASAQISAGNCVFQRGEYLLCSMGTAVPEPFDTVVPVERVRFSDDGSVVLSALPGRFGGTCDAGSSIRAGEPVVPAHHRLSPSNLSILRYVGIESVPVLKKPRVIIAPVGDDLVMPGQVPGAGQSVEANSLLLSGIIEMCGGCVQTLPILPDDINHLCRAFEQAAAQCELLIPIGGAGTGGAPFHDQVLPAVKELGEVLVQGTGFGPGGKAQFLGTIGKACVVGIPGPPHAAITQAEQYLPAVMERFLGCACYEREEITAIVSDAFENGIRAGYHPHVRVRWENGKAQVFPVRMGDTVDCFVRANGILMHDRDVFPGDEVPVRLVYGAQIARRQENSEEKLPEKTV